ncbi:MAG: GAF domain-containing protein [Thermoflexales bacterium]|nr:GAF domain-containing protein [Thermoflexales bacterium]
MPSELSAQERLERQARLLEAAAKVGQAVTSLLDLDELFSQVVDIICDAYGFYYAGVFLLDPHQPGWAVLRTGRGEAGRKMVDLGHKLQVGDTSMIGWCIHHQQARIALDVGQDAVRFENPHLPDTRSEMALPLIVGAEAIGALTVQSVEEAAFSEMDITSLQAMANHLAVAIQNAQTHSQARRRARLLETAAQVGSTLTSILDLDVLLPRTVDLVCAAYDFYYAGIFLVDQDRTWALLRAGHGEPGRVMLALGHKLEIADKSMIGWCINHKQARIALDVGQDAVRFNNPHTPKTRSEMALPLIVGSDAIGAVTIQSAQMAAFSADDITSLQAMADHLAVAIHNAHLLVELEKAHHELVRTKTFEAIASATGEAIHWIGNKALPIVTTVERLRSDVAQFALLAGDTVRSAPPALQEQAMAQLVNDFADKFAGFAPEARQAVDSLKQMPLKRARRLLNPESVNEDLALVDEGARLIVAVKEGLIGPTREHRPRPAIIQDVVKDTVTRLVIPPNIVRYQVSSHAPMAIMDTTQMGRVFTNLLKNALEAMEGRPEQRITLSVLPAEERGFVKVMLADTGCGIPPEDLDKIWVVFYTTKDSKVHPGLGLAACLQVVEQMDGQISVKSQPGTGTVFTILLPAADKGKAALPPGDKAVLLVDDDDEWRRFAQAALEGAGYRVRATTDLQGVDPAGFDRILVEQSLECVEVMDVLQALRQAGVRERVVVLSSSLVVEQTTDLLQAGVSDVALKPYTVEELARLV